MNLAQINSMLMEVVGTDHVEKVGESLIARPANTQEVAELVRRLVGQGIKLGVAGGNTTSILQSGAEVFVSLSRMNQILDFDRDNMVVLVQAGMVTWDFQKRLLDQGLYFPVDPLSKEKSTLGGNVACRASGPTMMSHGETVDFLLGLTAVLPTGEILKVGGKNYKNVAGFDLNRIYGGSRGRLGIITELYLRIIPKPEVTSTILVPFSSIVEAAERSSALTTSGIIPNKLELLDESVLRKLGDRWPAEYRSGAVALIEVEGYRESIEHQIEIVVGGLNRSEEGQYKVLEGEEEASLWQARAELAGMISSGDGHFLNLVVDPTVLSRAVEEIVQKATAEGFPLGLIIHGSASHIHPVLLDASNGKKQRMETSLADLMNTLGGRLVPDTLSYDPGSQDLNTVLISRLVEMFDPQGLMAG
ncbi:MAG TPA: FAD-binding oxidoreductase [Clostridia bacterium]|nr:FAD-binding oxidoreductase [Clostridia bacterium]